MLLQLYFLFIFTSMYLRILLYALLLGLPLLSYSRQVTVGEVTGQPPFTKNYEYAFPHIIYPANKAVAAAINNTLVADFLRIDPKEVRKSIFEAVWPQEKDAMPPLNDISWVVHANTRKLLSLAISAEGCGAYCEYFTSYYSFDLKTGKLLGLDQVFNKEGLLLLKDSVNRLKKESLQAVLARLRKELRDTTISVDDVATLKETIELYQDCLDRGGIETIQGHGFYLHDGNLFIRLDRCSAHVNRALDQLGEFEFSFKCADLKQYLTPYGQQLLQ